MSTLQHPTPARQRRKLLAIAAALAVLAAVPVARHAWLTPALAAGAPTARAEVVKTARVTTSALPIALTGIGTVTAAQSVTVHTRIDGQLDSVAFREGQDVKAGQLLAQLDDRALKAQVALADAQRARDEAQLANAEADLQRFTGLVRDKAATQQQLDTQAALVRQLQATVRGDAASLAAAQVQLSYTRITAPISGRIGARLVDAGNIVHAADTTGLLVINAIDPITVQFTLPDGSFQDVNAALNAVGARGKLTVQALDRSSHTVLAEGQLALLNNQIDTTTGSVMLKASFSNPQHRLWPGQQVEARLVLRTQADALVVPSAAVQRSQQGMFAYVVQADGTVRAQPVRVAGSEGERTQVLQGLAAGDTVVVDGQYRLKPGTRVTDATAAGSAASGAAK